jgi:hypothetical protein
MFAQQLSNRMINMKNNYFVSENNNLNRDNYGYFADQSKSNWTLKTQRVGSWNTACGAYEPDSDKIPKSAWVGVVLSVGCIFLALFL